MAPLAKDIMPVLKPGAVLTDVGSVKQCVLDEILPVLKDDVHLVPGHPIAGTEYSGPDAGFAELFEGRWCILTPSGETNLHAVETVAGLWRDIGGDVEFMDARHHDLVLAITSHLPHLIAFNIVAPPPSWKAIRAAPSSNIPPAASAISPALPHPTRLCGAIFLCRTKTRFWKCWGVSMKTVALQRAIRHGDADYLQSTFSQTREIRQSVIDAGQDVDAPNFGRDLPANPMRASASAGRGQHPAGR